MKKRLTKLLLVAFMILFPIMPVKAQATGGYLSIPLFCSPNSKEFLDILRNENFTVQKNWVEEEGLNIITYWGRPLKDNYSFVLTITFAEGISCILSMGNQILLKGTKISY